LTVIPDLLGWYQQSIFVARVTSLQMPFDIRDQLP
jgi:hypothetical protein